MGINEVLKKLPPAPSGIDKWIRQDLADKTYIIYNKKDDIAVCTRCGHKFKASRFYMKHDYEGECPKCKHKATYLASGRGRKKFTEYMRVLIFTHKGKTVYGTLTEIELDYSPFGQPDIKTWLSAVYTFNENEQHYYKHHPGWCFGPEYWEEVKNIKLPHPPSTMNFYSTPRFNKTEVYEANLENVFRKSCLKYLYNRDMFETHEFDAYNYVRYMQLGLKYQSIELLTKAGFEQLVIDKVTEAPGSGCVNWRGKDLKKILRLPMRDVRRIRKHNPHLYELNEFQGLTDKQKALPWNVISEIARLRRYYNVEQNITKYTDFIKWCEWSAQQNVYHNDWMDYIGDCKKLGLDIRKNKILFPENFREVHQELALKVEQKEDAKKAAGFARYAKIYDLQCETDNLMVMIADSQTALNTESSVLCHCVRTYGDRVAKGNTCIFFIRKKSDPDMPYYTLEITPDGKFIQCRGKHNSGMTEEVKAFKDMIVSEFNKKIKKLKSALQDAGRSAA